MSGKLTPFRRPEVAAAPPEADYDAFADTLMALAADVAEADRRIKRAILAAAKRGDLRQVEQLANDWLERPSTDVAAGL